MRNKKVLYLTQAAMIAALYVVLTFVSNTFGLASNVIQVRLSEMLTILPYFISSAIPGITIGCLLSNLFTQGCLLDIIFGTFATLLGAFGSYLLRKQGKKFKFLVAIPPILANTIIVPWILRFGYGAPDALPYMMLTVGIGEIISCGILGTLLLVTLEKYKNIIFKPSFKN